MNLFKNGVGRPSNETLRKRKMFYIGITIVLIAVVLVSGYFLISKFNGNKDAGDTGGKRDINISTKPSIKVRLYDYTGNKKGKEIKTKKSGGNPVIYSNNNTQIPYLLNIEVSTVYGYIKSVKWGINNSGCFSNSGVYLDANGKTHNCSFSYSYLPVKGKKKKYSFKKIVKGIGKRYSEIEVVTSKGKKMEADVIMLIFCKKGDERFRNYCVRCPKNTKFNNKNGKCYYKNGKVASRKTYNSL